MTGQRSVTEEPCCGPADDGAASTECCDGETRADDAAVDADVRLLSALANETRYGALRLLEGADGDVCVCDLEPQLDVSQSAVSHALSALYSAGLVDRRKSGRWRYYGLTPAAETLLGALDDVREER